MRRLFAILTALLLCISSLASADGCAGRWVGMSVEIGSLGLMCDVAGIDLLLELNEDGTAVMTLNGESASDVWHETDGVLAVGAITLTLKDEHLIWTIAQDDFVCELTLIRLEEESAEEDTE